MTEKRLFKLLHEASVFYRLPPKSTAFKAVDHGKFVKLWNEEEKSNTELLEEIDFLLAYFEDFIKGEDGMKITRLRGKINYILYGS